jgi:hypothetical protein
VSWNFVLFFFLFFSLKSRIVPSQSNPVAQRVGTHHHLHTTTKRTQTRREKKWNEVPRWNNDYGGASFWEFFFIMSP